MAGPSSQPATTPSNPRITAHATAATGCSHGHATGATICTHGHATGATDCSHGHVGLSDPPASASTPQLPNAKKGKGKKAADPNETGKLLAAKINQLELDAAGDKEQELEIGGLFFSSNFFGVYSSLRRDTVLNMPKTPNFPIANILSSYLPSDRSN